AENGYVCLVVDTLQLGEVAGLHHGTHRLGLWWWQSLGYTPAGVELWNGIRALDYLEARPEVDKERIGVTGRSGGGATSWWLMAADDRVACGVPVAGLADMLAHVSEGYPGRLAGGVIGGHCDCMYFVNTRRWDLIQVMALCAPRPLLLGNSDDDTIFPVPGYRRPAGPVKALYEAMGAGERFGLLETKGPHKDTPELRQGAFRWLNRWLKNDTGAVTQPDRPRHDPVALKAVDRNPPDAINDIVHERFIRPARVEMPDSPEVARAWWDGKSAELRKRLLDRVFTGWPEKPCALNARATEKTVQGVRVSAIDFDSEDGVPLRAWLLRTGDPAEVLVSVCDEPAWGRWAEDLGPDFAGVLYGAGNPPPSPYPPWRRERLDNLRRSMDAYGWAFAVVAPRGVGPTRWSDREPQHVRRRFALLGQTLEGQQAWDVRRALAALPAGGAKLTLQAEGDVAAAALYAALFEPRVGRLELTRPPATHRSGPAFLNVLTVLDLPQAVALLAPREVAIDGDEADWAWPLALQKKLGGKGLTVRRRGE
ncbi:MAG: alpha/beta hydrolase family protein, partial [Gemmataceae bacterium]